MHPIQPASLSLDEVISNQELARREARTSRPAAERYALESLARQLSGSPRRILQALSDAAMDLCAAHSAGISLVEEDGARRFFRWHAVSGRWSAYLWNTLPREFSPCGTVLDREAAQLMILPERHFTPLAQISPKVHEVLLIPFSVGEIIVGTVWIIAHDESRKFDAEDLRVVASIAKFAAVAYAGLSSLSSEDVLHLARLAKTHSGPRELPVRSIQRRVLIVDRNAGTASILAATLRKMGHAVKVAHDGRAAVAECARDRPDLVLLDVGTPDAGGYDVAREMRRTLGPGVRIAVVTGYANDEEGLLSLEAGVDLHLVRPLDPVFLQSLIG